MTYAYLKNKTRAAAIKGFYYLIKRPAFTCNYLFGNYKEKIWLVGSARSGTTWIASLINWQNNYRELFEPFNFLVGDKLHARHPYVRDGLDNEYLENMGRRIFSGLPVTRRIDQGNGGELIREFTNTHEGVLVKDVTSHFYAHLIKQRYPNIKLIFLIRNPFSVAISKLKKKDWFSAEEQLAALSQPHLVEDVLSDHRHHLAAAKKDSFLREIMYWSVTNHVPLKRLSSFDDVYRIYYEDFFLNPLDELIKLHSFFWSEKRFTFESGAINKIVRNPSRVTGSSGTVARGLSPIYNWQSELSHEQIRRAREIIASFGLDGLYGGEALPKRTD